MCVCVYASVWTTLTNDLKLCPCMKAGVSQDFKSGGGTSQEEGGDLSTKDGGVWDRSS